jgi:hypothetical protein
MLYYNHKTEKGKIKMTLMIVGSIIGLGLALLVAWLFDY